VVICTDYIGSCKSKYHTITTADAPLHVIQVNIERECTKNIQIQSILFPKENIFSKKSYDKLFIMMIINLSLKVSNMYFGLDLKTNHLIY